MQTVAVSGAPAAQSTTTDRGVSSMKSEDFFKLLVSELKQQDPLQPAKTADMIGQVSQIRSIELSKNLTDALSQMTQQQRTAGAADLLGKYVTATLHAADGTTSDVSGIVTGVRFESDGTAVLELDTGQTVSAADVTLIASAEAAERAKTAATATTAAKTAATATTDEATKAAQTAKSTSGGLLPFLTMDGSFHL